MWFPQFGQSGTLSVHLFHNLLEAGLTCPHRAHIGVCEASPELNCVSTCCNINTNGYKRNTNSDSKRHKELASRLFQLCDISGLRVRPVERISLCRPMAILSLTSQEEFFQREILWALHLLPRRRFVYRGHRLAPPSQTQWSEITIHLCSYAAYITKLTLASIRIFSIYLLSAPTLFVCTNTMCTLN